MRIWRTGGAAVVPALSTMRGNEETGQGQRRRLPREIQPGAPALGIGRAVHRTAGCCATGEIRGVIDAGGAGGALGRRARGRAAIRERLAGCRNGKDNPWHR